jgi:hypothetical protein
VRFFNTLLSLPSASPVRALAEVMLQTPTALDQVFWEAKAESIKIECRFNMLVPCRCIFSALVQALLNTMGK